MSGRGRTPTWIAVALGLVLGLGAAAGGRFAWNRFGRGSQVLTGAGRAASPRVDLFRLPSGAEREMFLVPAGPDANGEPALAKALFPGEDPPRELASLVLANVSADEAWTVDLESLPVACRRSTGSPWEELGRPRDETLGDSERLRLRSLGTHEAKVLVEPRSLRRVLLVLPPRTRIADLSDVQWGTTPLLRDQLDLERVRRFREDPAAVTTGR